jgi:hypothetical protein
MAVLNCSNKIKSKPQLHLIRSLSEKINKLINKKIKVLKKRVINIFQKLLQDQEHTLSRNWLIKNSLEAKEASFKRYSTAKFKDFKIKRKNINRLLLSAMKMHRKFPVTKAHQYANRFYQNLQNSTIRRIVYALPRVIMTQDKHWSMI